MKLRQAWQAAWYEQSRLPLGFFLLLPFTLLFWFVSHIRALCYRLGVLSAYQSSLPVIIVGNISVGGNGKTPVVIALVEAFLARGIPCAVLSRGYGGSQTVFPHRLTTQNNQQISPLEVGDEPALLAKRFGAKLDVVIDPKRARAAKFIEQHSQAQVIICDDGMQHYALKRDYEICVMDKRFLGNGFVMPMGPLRESAARLASVDSIICNMDDKHFKVHGQSLKNLDAPEAFQMHLEAKQWVNVCTGQVMSLENGLAMFEQTRHIAAIAGIGDPSRFFMQLSAMGISLRQEKAMADHANIALSDLPEADIVLMTEKDAVKCSDFALEHLWYLQVSAVIPEHFFSTLIEDLNLGKK